MEEAVLEAEIPAQSVQKRELNTQQKINVLAASGLMAAVSLEVVQNDKINKSVRRNGYLP